MEMAPQPDVRSLCASSECRSVSPAPSGAPPRREEEGSVLPALVRACCARRAARCHGGSPPALFEEIGGVRLLLTRLCRNTTDETEPEVPFEAPILLVNTHCTYLVLGELLGKLLERGALRWRSTPAYTRHLDHTNTTVSLPW